jgi:hypothetical protein
MEFNALRVCLRQKRARLNKLYIAPKELGRRPKQNNAKQRIRIFRGELVSITETKSVEMPGPIALSRDAIASVVDD